MSLKRLMICLCALFLLTACTAGYAADYYAQVDKTNQIVTVFTVLDGDIGRIVRQMICSTGDDTPDGVYQMPLDQKETDRGEWYYTLNTYVKWPTRVLGGFLFHSIPYNAKDDNAVNQEALKALGTPVSHGCIRLYANDAKWVSENLRPGDIVDFVTVDEDRTALREQLRAGSYDGTYKYEEFLAGDSTYTRPDDVGEIITYFQSRTWKVVYITNNEFLNIRSKKDFKSDLAGFVPVGAVVEVVKVEGRWTRIRYREYEGWISTAYTRDLK